MKIMKIMKIMVIFLVVLSVSCVHTNTKDAEVNKDKAADAIFDALKLEQKLQKSERKYSKFDQKYASSGNKDKNYRTAISLIDNGRKEEGINILQSLVNNFPNYLPAREVLDRLESPFTLASSVVEQYIDGWISAPSNVPEFKLQKPTVPELPEHPVLKKGEFETTGQFKLRVKNAEEQYQLQVAEIKREYKANVNYYNQTVNTYNKQIDWERKNRAEKVPAMRKRYLDVAFTEALGNPIVESLKYDADNENFYGKVISANDNLSFDVEIPVVIAEARVFKDNIDNIKTAIKIDLIDGNIVFSKVSFDSQNKTYPAKILGAERILPTVADVTIGSQDVDFNQGITLPTIRELEVQEIIKDNHQFFTPKNN